MSIDNEKNKIEVCEEEADFGVYMGIRTPSNGDGYEVTTLSVSFCLYHTIYQESIWVGGGQE